MPVKSSLSWLFWLTNLQCHVHLSLVSTMGCYGRIFFIQRVLHNADVIILKSHQTIKMYNITLINPIWQVQRVADALPHINSDCLKFLMSPNSDSPVYCETADVCTIVLCYMWLCVFLQACACLTLGSPVAIIWTTDCLVYWRIYVSKVDDRWFRQWRVAWSVLSHYLSQCGP